MDGLEGEILGGEWEFPNADPPSGYFSDAKWEGVHVREMVLDLPLPQDREAERSLLSLILKSSAAYGRTAHLVREEYFFMCTSRSLYRGMSALAARGERIDSAALERQLSESETLVSAGGAGYISELSAYAPETGDPVIHAARIREQYLLRKGIIICHSGMRYAFHPEATSKNLVSRLSGWIQALRREEKQHF